MNRKLHILLLTVGIGLCGLAALILVIIGFKVYCPFQLITGLNCPGCGNTRAVLALFRMDLRSMLQYNLTFPVQMLYIARVYITCAKRYIQDGRFSYHIKPDVIDISFLIMLVLWTVIRNCTPLY